MKMSLAKFSAIVPAAGKGSRIARRLGTKKVKPFLEIGGVPILVRSLKMLEQVPEVSEIIVATAPRHRALVLAMARQFAIRKLRRVVAGGKTRTDSVFNALRASNRKCPFVLVHDGVRPFILAATVRKAIRCFLKDPSSGLIVGRPAIPTIKEVRSGLIAKTLDRSLLWEIETPQIFERETLIRAYDHFYSRRLKATDDAQLAEMIHVPVRTFQCEEENMKITTPEDLDKAGRILDAAEFRVGTGEDRHRLKPWRPLYLGGLRVPSSAGAEAHSDGDVLIHAIVDALLGALGLGDIGEFFPDTDPKFKGGKSTRFLEKVLGMVRGKGFEVVNVDSTVVLEAPKLSPWKKKIQGNLAHLLGLSADQVGVKAKTSEGLGPEGERRSIAAHAVVSLRRKKICCG